MNEPFLHYGPMRLLNLPGAKAVYDEVLVEDCYHKATIPPEAIVLDVGGFYGEFGIWCYVHRHCHVALFEPSDISFQVACLNSQINHARIELHQSAIAGREENRAFHLPQGLPVGGRLHGIGQDNPCVQAQITAMTQVRCLTLLSQIQASQAVHGKSIPVCVKLDCEGAEREIFSDQSWLPLVSWLALEFHYKDGPFYHDILTRHGFQVSTSDSNPEAWRAIICAHRI